MAHALWLRLEGRRTPRADGPLPSLVRLDQLLQCRVAHGQHLEQAEGAQYG
ncbi:hypothetical protein [Halomonas sp. WWR20]